MNHIEDQAWKNPKIINRYLHGNHINNSNRVHYKNDPSSVPILSKYIYRMLQVDNRSLKLSYIHLTYAKIGELLRTPSKVLYYGIGDYDDYAILYITAATYYLGKIKSKYAIILVC